MVEATGRQHFKAELMENAKKIATAGKGILAADESTGTIGLRFKGINVEPTTENTRTYRDLLFTAPGIEEYISGVIMFEETLGQETAAGVNFVKHLASRGILSGIKVDKGVVVMGGTQGEKATQGLDGLAGRCKAFYEQGCRFAKWRCVLNISVENGLPSELSINETAHTLARYGGICQDNGLVPIIEPEIMIDGNHSLDTCAGISERVFARVMAQMLAHHLIIEGCLLKPNMVTPGSEWSGTPATNGEIAWATVRTLSRTIVPALPAVTFLSGGQSEEDASLNLNAINQIKKIARP
jgi:fructose-bisphosphate aldolase class I